MLASRWCAAIHENGLTCDLNHCAAAMAARVSLAFRSSTAASFAGVSALRCRAQREAESSEEGSCFHGCVFSVLIARSSRH
jgi:hypothetical protein